MEYYLIDCGMTDAVNEMYMKFVVSCFESRYFLIEYTGIKIDDLRNTINSLLLTLQYYLLFEKLVPREGNKWKIVEIKKDVFENMKNGEKDFFSWLD